MTQLAKRAWKSDDKVRKTADSSVNFEHFFESIVTDVQWSSYNVATILMLLTAKTQEIQMVELSHWRRILIDSDRVAILLLRYGREMDLPQSVAASMTAFYENSSRTKIELLQAVIDAREKDPSALLPHVDNWRSLASSAQSVLRSLNPLIRQRLPELYTANAKIVCDFLFEAMRGSFHRVNVFGEISLPVLVQRRHGPRSLLMQSCRVMIAGRTVRAQLKDVSRQGLGISCPEAFEVGSEALVELEDGRRLKAQVVWSTQNQSGLKLEVTLSDLDPLFQNSNLQ